MLEVTVAVGLPIPALLNPVEGLHEYPVPPVALSCPTSPIHIVAEVVLTTGSGFTVMVAVPVLVQPLALVTVTVYTVVEVALEIGFPIPVLFSPVAGVHEYPVPPVALSCPVPPIHMAAEVVFTTGKGLTVTVTVPLPVHPLASVTLMV